MSLLQEIETYGLADCEFNRKLLKGLNMDFIYHTDSGHGWVETEKEFLKQLNIDNLITGYSYEYGDKAYLEEDCDLSTLIKALEAQNITYTLKEVYKHQSPIRNYPQYKGA